MLRVSPDGKDVWVLAGNNTVSVLSTDDLSTLATNPTATDPETNAWTPDGRYSFVMTRGVPFTSVFDARTFRDVHHLETGKGSSNVGFTRDGKTAFISVTDSNSVAVVDVAKLEVLQQLKVGSGPQGLIVLTP